MATDEELDAARSQADAWQESARQAREDRDRYTAILDRIGALLGPDAYAVDESGARRVDYSILPDVVEILIRERDENQGATLAGLAGRIKELERAIQELVAKTTP